MSKTQVVTTHNYTGRVHKLINDCRSGRMSLNEVDEELFGWSELFRRAVILDTKGW